jgi:hypothetical protein
VHVVAQLVEVLLRNMTESSLPVLTTRALNRALLARQLLLERSPGPMEAAVEQVGGLQTQNAPSGYIGLWSRLAGLRRDDYTAALNERRLVQGWLMRVTIHTVSAADYWPMAIAVREARRAWWLRTWAGSVTDDEMRAAAGAIRELLADGPLRQKMLRERMAQHGFSREVANAAALWVDLVRVPPQGTWERPRADNYGLAEQWLPPVEMGAEEARDRLLRQYLAAFGPASMADASGWTGLPVADLRPVAERTPLERYRDEAGRELLDLPGAPMPGAETPAPARFLGSFDPTLLIQARRTQILPEAFQPLIFQARTPRSWHTFLVDGQVAGTWTYQGAMVELQPLRELAPDERRAVE